MITFFLTSSFIIAAVLAARFLLKNKVSSMILYPLWLIVLLRLLVPVNMFESRLSIMNIASRLSTIEKNTAAMQDLSGKIIAEKITQEYTNESNFMEQYQQSQSKGEQNKHYNQSPDEKINIHNSELHNYTEKQEATVSPHAGKNKNPNDTDIIRYALIIWILGSLFFFTSAILSNGVFYKKLHKNRKPVSDSYFDQGYYKNIPVYTTDIVTTPCLTGMIHPSIYLPSGQLKDNTKEYLKQILKHEYTHYKHKDHIWSLLRVICLAIYWFHPFVWLAAYYSKQDAELACDETVLRGCTDEERYYYGKMLLSISQNKNKNGLRITASFHHHQSNLRERIIMITKKRTIQKIHIAWLTLFSIILTGCGFTSETTTLSGSLPKSKTPAAESFEDKKNSVNNDANDTFNYKENKLMIPAIHPSEDETVKAFENFMKGDIKERPELKKWKNSINQLYFSVQYTTDQTPCLFVTDHVFSHSTNYAYVYYYDTNEKEIKLLTYLSTSGSGDDIQTIYGKFITTTHHSYRVYDWNQEHNHILAAEEIYGYFITADDSGKQSENFTRTVYKWNIPLENKEKPIASIKGNEFLGSQNKVDQSASDTKTTKQYSVIKALEFYHRYDGAAPVMFYQNTPKKWNQFYKDGHMNSNGYASMQGNFKNTVQKNIEQMTDYDYMQAEKEQSLYIHNACLYYLGDISDHQSLFYINADDNQRAFIVRTGLRYNIYLLDSPKKQNQTPPNYSGHDLLQIKHSEFYTEDYDNDQEMETAFYIIENPDTAYESKTTYIIDYQYIYYQTDGMQTSFVADLHQVKNNTII